MGAGSPIGRTEVLAEAWRWLTDQHSLLVTGPPGAGRSTVLHALADRATAAGTRVLRSAPGPAEAELPFATLIDLLAGFAAADWARLPADWRAALARVEQARPAALSAADRLAVRLAVLRLLTAAAPVLLVIDDLPWVDPASAEVLRFVSRRVRRLPVRVLAAVRGRTTPPELRELCPEPVRVLPVPPLAEPALGELLEAHLGTRFPRPWLSRIAAVSGGNPRWALAIGQELAQLPALPTLVGALPVPAEVRAALREHLPELPASVRQTLLFVAAAGEAVAPQPAPTVGMLRRAGRGRVVADLAVASAQGVVSVDGGGRIRFTDAAVAAALYADLPAPARRRVHAALAAAVADPIARARHRALAAPGPSEAVARALMRAAQVARERGEPAVAAELGVLAADRTPGAERAAGRLVRAARDALAAGHRAWAQQIAEAVLAAVRARRPRVEAWLVLLDASGQALARTDALLRQALAETRNAPGLRARVGLRLGAKLLVEGAPEPALVESRRCEALAARAGDSATRLQALCLQATAELVLGRPELSATLQRAEQLAAGRADVPLLQGPRHVAARALLHADRLAEARQLIRQLLAQAERDGRPEDVVGVLLNLAEVDLRAGRCGPARQAAARARRVAREAGLSDGPGLAVAALVEAVAGDPARARAWAERGVGVSGVDGDRFFLLRNLHALGVAELLSGDAAAAVTALRRADELAAGMGELDPALFRFHADLAEALVAAQQLAEAAEVISRAQLAAQRCGRDGVRAELERASGVRALALGQVGEAADRLRAAAAASTDLPLAQVRALLALGVAERRRRRRAAAREAFEQAWELASRCQAETWVRRAAAELTRAAPVAGGELTALELRIAELVAEGATNKQVARAVSISVKTVEAYLTRVYRKLRVRSRTELASWLASVKYI